MQNECYKVFFIENQSLYVHETQRSRSDSDARKIPLLPLVPDESPIVTLSFIGVKSLVFSAFRAIFQASL